MQRNVKQDFSRNRSSRYYRLHDYALMSVSNFLLLIIDIMDVTDGEEKAGI